MAKDSDEVVPGEEAVTGNQSIKDLRRQCGGLRQEGLHKIKDGC